MLMFKVRKWLIFGEGAAVAWICMRLSISLGRLCMRPVNPLLFLPARNTGCSPPRQSAPAVLPECCGASWTLSPRIDGCACHARPPELLSHAQLGY